MQDCVFCEIVKGKVPAHKIWEDAKHLAILSIFPNTPGFTVVLTKEHKPSYAFNNDNEVLTGLVLASKKVAKLLDAAFEDVGRTGMFFEGFGVDHLHSKLFPMHGTADMKKWKAIHSSKKEFFEKYPGYLSSHDADRADDSKLAQMAERIQETAKKLRI